MTVGDKIKQRMKIWDSDRKGGGSPTEVTVDATVVYINTEHRFYTLRYDFGPGRSYRESFKFT